jgi:Flp pilus assembly pilin Flp
MLNFIKNFKNDESGAVTVDWVVLTAAIVLLGAAVGTSVSKGATDLATSVGADLTLLSQ